MVVVLPAPFGPRMPVTAPHAALSVSPSTAAVWPYRLTSLPISTAGSCGTVLTHASLRWFRCKSVSMSELPARSRAVWPSGPGITRFGNAGSLFHRPVPVRDGSYLGSAGVYALRPTGGEPEQVPRGVHIPVHHQSARLAGENPLRERQAWLSPPARRARPGTGIPAVSDKKLAAVPGRLVAEHPPRRAEPLVGHGASQPPVGEHARH